MNKCMICGKDSGKGKTCSNTCRSKLARSVAKGVAPATVDKGVATVEATTMIANYGQPDCDCQHCKTNRFYGSWYTINHGKHKTADQLGDRELNRVTLPGDVDYKKSGVVEHCQSCDAILPQLEQPRVHTGTCYPCSSSTSQPAHTATTGHKTDKGQVTANG